MGSIIGGIIGGIGSLVGGSQAKDASKQAAGLDLTGYNYLTSGAGAPTINAAQTAGINGSQNQTNIQGTEGALLGLGGNTDAANKAFNNYLGSTGYQFQMDQGSRAISGNAATRGLLNSGATAKALTSYGQGLAGQYFNNYLGQLGGLNTQATNTAGQGIDATLGVGKAGTTGGGNAGQHTLQGGEDQANGTSAAGSSFGHSAAGSSFVNSLGSLASAAMSFL